MALDLNDKSNMTGYVIRLLRDEYIANVDKNAMELKEIKERHRASILDLIAAEDDLKLRRVLASAIYILDKTISAIELAPLMGAPQGTQQVQKYIMPVQLTRKCRHCDTDVPAYIKSRSKIKYDKYGQFKELDYGYATCADCEDKIKEDYQSRTSEFDERIKALKTMAYADYLQTDHWKDTRKRALKRAGFKCELCNQNGQLHVHHKTYARRGNEWSKDLMVLCANCHAKFHDKLEEQTT